MGIAYRCDAAAGLAVVVWDGKVTVEDATRHARAVAADRVWIASHLFVTDAMTVSADDRAALAEVAAVGENFLQELAPRIGWAKWAVIADSIFDDVRKLEAHLTLDVHRMLVFNSLPTACVWLDVDPRGAEHRQRSAPRAPGRVVIPIER